MNYLLRPCHEDDLATIVQLCEKHAVHEQATYHPEGKQALLMKALFNKNPSLFCLVVEIDNKVEGYASYTFDFSTWEAGYFLYLDCLYLEPACRGYGIGEAIMQTIKQVAADKGCVNVQWQTPVFNEGAIKFYRRIGATGKEKIRFQMDI